MTEKVVLGIDIGGTNLRLALVDNNYKTHDMFITNIADYKNKNFKKWLINTINDYIENSSKEVAAIGVGVPGIVDRDQIISCPNITELENSKLKETLYNQFNIPIVIEKDVNLIMLAEQKLLNRTAQNIVGFFIGTGFGCSIIINGRLYKGFRGFAGELGHIPLKGKSKPCNCGSKGCLEMYAAGKALEKIASNNNITIENFFIDMKGKSEVEEFLDNLAIGIVTSVNLLDPELIIIDGGVIRMKGFPLKYLKELIKQRLRSNIMIDNLEIIDSNIGKYGGCLGAGVYFFDYIQK
ncbi:allose kinase [Halocella sp. SP3-1]|uniref:allose kinase n=1 Tax=Halocella sp. SP3-1 TaxID=2382161 RepID=UPI000F759EB1|nr:allose kinase [Halocella sp. SP3-1]AZO93756.1 allose kinase [Halocella sp. SP3-1]MTI58983.1 allose kinase [Bacillota bacterium]